MTHLMSELGMRRARDARTNPVEAAFWAISALSDEDKQRLAQRYNAHQSKKARPGPLLTFSTPDNQNRGAT